MSADSKAQDSETQKKVFSLDDVRSQFGNYDKLIRDLLAKFDAQVQNYKFSIEKSEKGMDIDVAFKVSISTTEKEVKHASAHKSSE
jgi:hypothetical protein